MQQEQTDAAPSFAGLMAALTAARAPAANWDGLEDDVATLSYEQALRRQARSRPEAAPASETAAEPVRAAGERSRKDASITVRLSRAECAQLQQRAAEAGLTVSAYLRSCTLEVESLRAQVKQTLAELRMAQTAKPRPWLRLLRGRRASLH